MRRQLIFLCIIFLFVAGCGGEGESEVRDSSPSISDRSDIAHDSEPINLEALRVLLDVLRKLDVHHRGVVPRIEINLQEDGSAQDAAGNILLNTREEWAKLIRFCRASLEIHGSEFMIRTMPPAFIDDDYGDALRSWYTVEIDRDDRMTWIVVPGPDE